MLESCIERGGRCSRSVFIDQFMRTSTAQKRHAQSIVTRSIERLIARGLLAGYGLKTKEKLFIQSVRITPLGRRTVAAIQKHKQKLLPFAK